MKQPNSQVLTSDGDVEDLSYELQDIYDGKPFFRKYVSDDYTGTNELDIVEIIKSYKSPKLLQIYYINHEKRYYDAELLNTSRMEIKIMKSDITESVEVLSGFNIVYIDFKLDNIGYSWTDKRYKLFDFDCSGVKKSSTQWKISPPLYYNMKHAVKILLGLNKDVYCVSEEDYLDLLSLDDGIDSIDAALLKCMLCEI